MSGCLDRVECGCDWLDPAREWLRPKRNMIASIAAGTLVCVYIAQLVTVALYLTLHVN